MQSQMAAKQQGTWPVKLITYSLDYLVVAGGGGGGTSNCGCGGGGAGGYRASGYGPSPLRGSSLPFSNVEAGNSHTVTVGAGGSTDSNGTNSVFESITSTGGGAGADVGGDANPAGS
jgi:hypothetical protein